MVNHLLADLGEPSYHPSVTDPEFWQAVGRELRRVREDKGLKSTSAVERAGGPTYKTVGNNERGLVGHVSSLQEHVDALGLSVVDLFRSVLAIRAEDMTTELALIVRKYQLADVDGRTALVATARAVRELPEPPDEEPRGRMAEPTGNTRAETEAPKRRAKK